MNKNDLPSDPAILLWGVLSQDRKTLIQKDVCTPLFIVALSTIAKTWNHPSCSTTDERIMKMWYIYTMECCIAVMSDIFMQFATSWMELEIMTLNEVSQKKDKY